jgi:pimeloyl-ACP methyl ester carboxylesterase
MWKIVDPQLAGTDNFTVGRGTLLDGAGNPTEALPVTFNANGIAEAVYQASDGFVRWGTPEEANDKERAERTIQPTVDLARYLLTGKDVFPPIRLKRPPVVLVHGLWGEPKVWDTFVNQLNRKEIYKIGRADYRTTNTEYLVENSQAIDAIIGEIIDNYVDEQFAVTKVDIVAHSMGGLVTREYCRQQALENNDCTRQIRKFITIGSPHSGSELANLVIDISQHPNSYLPFCRPLLSKLHGRGYRIWSDPANGIIAGAFIDLSTDSDAIQLLENNPTNLSWYAIVGQTSISSNVPGFKRRFAYDLRINFLWEGLYWACLTVPDASFYDLFGLLTRVFPEANDRIVSVSSQSKLSGKINRIADVDHYTVRNKSEVIDMIRTYLEVKGQ